MFKNINLLLLTIIAHNIATISRGYRAVGGEILILPLYYLIKHITPMILKDIKDTVKQLGGLK